MKVDNQLKQGGLTVGDYIQFEYYVGHRVNDTLPTQSALSNITVGRQSGYTIPSEWVSATTEAITRLNLASSDVGSYLHFTWTGLTSARVKIQLPTSGLPSGTIGNTNIGDSSHGVGEELRINPNCSFINTLTHNDRVSVMMHELLHTAGFRHTGTNEDGSVEVYDTDGYWDWVYAGDSIMKPGTWSFEFIPFLTFLDKRVLETKYK